MTLNYIPRVTQLDAVHLDNELEELLKLQIFNSTKFFEPGILQPYLPEIELLIRSWIFKNSIWKNNSTFGQTMLSLFYKKENLSKSKLYWYYGYTIGLRYFKDRMIYSYTRNTKIQDLVNAIEKFQLVGDVLNFINFIQSGKYPALVDLILGLEVSAEKLVREDLNDFSWTRELLWHNLIELIGTLISFMSMLQIQKKFVHLLRFFYVNKAKSRTIKNDQQPEMDLSTVCAYCSNKPILPHVMGCQHIFCYYCITANKAADSGFSCPQCLHSGKDINKYIFATSKS